MTRELDGVEFGQRAAPIIRVEFFDVIGTPLDRREWIPRDGIVWVPRDARQMRLTIVPEPTP
jgi:hypothetical protein